MYKYILINFYSNFVILVICPYRDYIYVYSAIYHGTKTLAEPQHTKKTLATTVHCIKGVYKTL